MRSGLLLLSMTLWPLAAAATADPAAVLQAAKKLSATRLDSSRSFPADGQVLEREGMAATFERGFFLPVVREEDGRMMGLVFQGDGTATAIVPAGVESTAWQRGTKQSSFAQHFDAAYLRFSDGTAMDLQGDRPWEEGSDTGGSAFRIHDGRDTLLRHPRWHRHTPDLVPDALLDLFGGGSVGGHLWAEFRVGDGRWLSYFTNPRGGLLLEERSAWFTLQGRGASPPDLHVLTSFGDVPEQGRTYDVRRIQIDATLRGDKASPRALKDGEFTAELEIVALQDGLRAIILELDRERPLCREESELGAMRLMAAKSADGTVLGAVLQGSRLFVVLPGTLARGASTTIHLGWEGGVTQGIPHSAGDVLYSELGPWAWHPRNPRADRFATRVVVHLPRYVSAVSAGALVEERQEKDGWHWTYEEPGGVRNLVLVVGDFVHTAVAAAGTGPAVMTWIPRPRQKDLPSSDDSGRAQVAFVAGLWGPYPYSTLHVVDSSAFPARNWDLGAGAQAGSWTCVPPGITHAWEGLAEGPSGVVFTNEPTTAPAWDVEESRVLGNIMGEDGAARRWATMAALARQWWGHLVLPRTYRDAWIPEALALITANAYAQASLGRSWLQERVETLRGAMRDGVGTSPPLNVGTRLGRDWPFQAWGRGTLVLYQLIAHVGANRATNAWRDLMARTAGRGVDMESLLASAAQVAPAELVTVLHDAAESTELPDVEWTPLLGGDGAIEGVLFHRKGADAVPLQVEVHVAGGKSVVESVLLQDEWTRFTSQAEKIKKFTVDPQGVALVRSITRQNRLAPPAESP